MRGRPSGLLVSSAGYLSVLIVGSFAGDRVGAWLADRLGRRNLFLIFSIGAIAIMLIYTQLELPDQALWVLGSRSAFLPQVISPAWVPS